MDVSNPGLSVLPRRDSATVPASYFIDPRGVIRAIARCPRNVGRSVERIPRLSAASLAEAADGANRFCHRGSA